MATKKYLVTLTTEVEVDEEALPDEDGSPLKEILDDNLYITCESSADSFLTHLSGADAVVNVESLPE